MRSMQAQGGMSKTTPECTVSKSVFRLYIQIVLHVVCYNPCIPKTQIFQCAHGHIVFGACKPDIKVVIPKNLLIFTITYRTVQPAKGP